MTDDKGRLDEAIAAYRQAIEIKPNQALAFKSGPGAANHRPLRT